MEDEEHNSVSSGDVESDNYAEISYCSIISNKTSGLMLMAVFMGAALVIYVEPVLAVHLTHYGVSKSRSGLGLSF